MGGGEGGRGCLYRGVVPKQTAYMDGPKRLCRLTQGFCGWEGGGGGRCLYRGVVPKQTAYMDGPKRLCRLTQGICG